MRLDFYQLINKRVNFYKLSFLTDYTGPRKCKISYLKLKFAIHFKSLHNVCQSSNG